MSSSPRNRPSDPPDNDSDSDLDLDVHELDPISTESIRGEPQNQSDTEQKPTRIALRNLRMGGLRRANKRGGRGYGDLGQDRDEDTQGLLSNQDGLQPRYSDGSANGDDNSPLLGESSGSQRKSFSSDRPTSRSGRSGLRLPSFMSGSSKKAEDDEREGQDDDPSASRLVAVGSTQLTRFPSNIVSNAKYTAFTFLPVTLYNEFSFFFNMYFLLVALSQSIPALRIGYLSTYIAPLAFVLIITMGKEAYDDIQRRKRDTEANSEEYRVLLFSDPGSNPQAIRPRRALKSDTARKGSKRSRARQGLSDIQEADDEEADGTQKSSHINEVNKKSKDLKVGDVLKLTKGQRVPADVVILQCYNSEGGVTTPAKEPAEEEALLALDESTDGSSKGKQVETLKSEDDGGATGETFIRTDQLDGAVANQVKPQVNNS